MKPENGALEFEIPNLETIIFKVFHWFNLGNCKFPRLVASAPRQFVLHRLHWAKWQRVVGLRDRQGTLGGPVSSVCHPDLDVQQKQTSPGWKLEDYSFFFFEMAAFLRGRLLLFGDVESLTGLLKSLRFIILWSAWTVTLAMFVSWIWSSTSTRLVSLEWFYHSRIQKNPGWW